MFQFVLKRRGFLFRLVFFYFFVIKNVFLFVCNLEVMVFFIIFFENKFFCFQNMIVFKDFIVFYSVVVFWCIQYYLGCFRYFVFISKVVVIIFVVKFVYIYDNFFKRNSWKNFQVNRYVRFSGFDFVLGLVFFRMIVCVFLIFGLGLYIVWVFLSVQGIFGIGLVLFIFVINKALGCGARCFLGF